MYEGTEWRSWVYLLLAEPEQEKLGYCIQLEVDAGALFEQMAR